jgi:hypothetical protein
VWVAAHPQGRDGGSPDGRGHAGGALHWGARSGYAPDGSYSPDRRGRTGGWADGDCGLYRWCGSPSPDRYHGHRRIQPVVKNVGPDVGWSTLTKTNYVEWGVVMRIQL